MKLKSAYRFQLREFIIPLIIFYSIVLLFEGILILTIIAVDTDGSMSGVEFSSWIFICVMGLIIFKPSFHFLSANSVSRKTMLISSLLTGLTMSAVLFILDTINIMVLKSLTIFNNDYVTIFEMLFNKKIVGINILKYALFSFVIYLLCFVIGYFIKSINYPLSQKIKLVVTIGIIVFFIFVFPRLIEFLQNADITFLDKLSDFIKINIFGSATGFTITGLIILVVLALISYIVTSRVNLKTE